MQSVFSVPATRPLSSILSAVLMLGVHAGFLLAVSIWSFRDRFRLPRRA